jgi:hypothetical protein
MAVTWGWDVGSEAERKPECDRNPCKVQGGPPRSEANSRSGPRGSRLAAGMTMPKPLGLPLRPCARVESLRGWTPAV